LIHFFIEDTTTFNLCSLTLFWLLPVGAILVGMAANSGYYFMTRWTHRMVDRYDFFGMTLLSAFGICAIYYIEYHFLVIQSGLGDEIGFWDFFKLVTESTEYRVRVGKIIPGRLPSLGWFNYVMVFVHFIGFLLGGAVTFLLIKASDICKPCSKYMVKVQAIKVFFGSLQSYLGYASRLGALDPENPNFLSDLVEKESKIPVKHEQAVRYTWTYKKCPSCNAAILKGEGNIRDGKEWKDLKDSSHTFSNCDELKL